MPAHRVVAMAAIIGETQDSRQTINDTAPAAATA
jgi:hypothetical protein